MSADARPHDLVLFGATGFTGQLVAEYLARARPARLRWALAGRSRQKLERVRAGLVAIDPLLATLPLLVADSADEAALVAIAAATRVVCTTVGPYMLHGRELAAACATNGTHYCDLAGEVPFIREVIDRWHAAAEKSGARIVPSCGFDSLPSDLGVHLLAEHFAARGLRLGEAKLYVEVMKGAGSGGTVASMLNLLEAARRDPALRRLLGDPYALNPDRTQGRGPDRGDQVGFKWDDDAKGWTAPFVMASINTRVVRRSNALRDFAYGRDFRYAEVSAFKSGPRGLARAAGTSAGVIAFVWLGGKSLTRSLLRRVLPAPGEGPSQQERDSGFFRIRIRGRSAPNASAEAEHASVLVEGKHDPGYGETARMLGEAALCLAFDELPARGGVLTPASCMGTHLVERLRAMGMTWRVEARSSGSCL